LERIAERKQRLVIAIWWTQRQRDDSCEGIDQELGGDVPRPVVVVPRQDDDALPHV
jgi:hypothetical protein